MSDDRIDDYLRGLDDATTAVQPAWDNWYAPSFDEWNAQRIAAGTEAGEISEYIEWIRNGEHHV